MRRDQIVTAAQGIMAALERSNLASALDRSLREARRAEQTLDASILGAFRDYAVLAASFSESQREIVAIFELDKLEDPATWSKVLRPDVASSGFNADAYQLYQAIRFTTEYLPRLAVLLDRPASSTRGRDEALPSGQAVLTVRLTESENSFSRPARLVELLQAVDALYSVCVVLNGLPSDELSVSALDSGSDKSFDFLGAAKAIACLKELILSMWDRVVLHREHLITERIKIVAGSLPVLREIADMREQGKLGPEQAARLTAKVVEGATQFLDSGAIIPEIEDRARDEPRKLLPPAQKLLAAKSASSVPDGRDASAESDDQGKQHSSPRAHRSGRKQRGTARKPAAKRGLTTEERKLYDQLRARADLDDRAE